VGKKGQEREEVRAKILDLSKKRAGWLKEDAATRGGKDGFDAAVLKTVREQASKKGITFEEK